MGNSPSKEEKFRYSLICALDAMNPTGELELNLNDGSVNVDGDNVYPKELVYHRQIERLLDRRAFHEHMGADARAIVNFICSTDSEVLQKYCGSKNRKVVTSKRVAKFFRRKWGRTRTRTAMAEIKKFLAI